MSDKTIEATLSGFTIAPDVLIEKYGHITALIWGKIWRYCQMEEGVCRAAIARLAKELNMSERTIERHIQTLEEGGYVVDLTPERRNAPHVYKDTGTIKISVFVGASESRTGTSESRGGTSQSRSQGVTESDEDTIKKQEDERFKQTAKKLAELQGGGLNSASADLIGEWLKKHTDEWILKAIQAAKDKGARSAVYVDKILIGWEANGYPPTREEQVRAAKVSVKQKRSPTTALQAIDKAFAGAETR